MTSRSFKMWISNFSQNNKEASTVPRVQDKDFKRGDRVDTPMGDGIFISCNEDTGECTLQMYSDNRTIRLNKAVIRKV